MLLRNICEFLRYVESVNVLPSHTLLYDVWKDEVVSYMNDADIEHSAMVDGVFEFREDMFAAAAQAQAQAQQQKNLEKPWKWLLTAVATGQRTTEWYAEGKRILTASEISAIWKGPRTRAALVMSKVPKEETPFTRRLAVNRSDTSPMDWGVRYEPVVKEILQNSLNITIYELGRIHHRSVKGIAASPDGLITEGPEGLVGTLVEIKCPTTRVINDKIPYDYWCQMQLQMEVCDIPTCEYVEVKFKEFDANTEADAGTPHGWITLEGNSDTMEMRYQYHSSTSSPPATADWIPIETYMWKLVQLRRITVQRDKEWFEKIQPDIATFWKDVQGACDGTWIPPPSTRKPKAAVAQVCNIQDSGPDI